MTETFAEIDDFVFQPADVGHYGCHIEDLSFTAIIGNYDYA
jgi:hypothetical protein